MSISQAWNRGRSLLVASTLLFPLAATAQTPAQERFAEQVDVSEVLLDVVVTDREGNVIIGLTPDDFVVKENGKPVDVATATFYSNRRLLDSPTPASGDVDTAPKPRYFILFLQEQQRANSDNPGLGLMRRQLEAVREMKKWVDNEKLLDDFVAVVSYDVKLKIHQDFTQDERAILMAVDLAAKANDPGSNWPSRLPQQGDVSLRAHLPLGKELDKSTRNVYQAMTVLAKATDGIVGRKNLVFFGTGFGDVNDFGLYKPDPRYYAPMVQALNTHNVAVYSVDLVPDTVDYELANGLNQLANETGGRYFYNFATFATPLAQIAAENSGYYLLSYRAERAAGTTGYQKVRVEAKNPEFRVKTREGYLVRDPA